MRITNRSLAAALERHPYPDSLLAISDLLSKWKVSHTAFRTTLSGMRDVPVPFIVHLQEKQDSFALVTKITDQWVELSNEKYQHHKMPQTKFATLFDGAVLSAEPDEASGEENYAEKRREEKWQNLRLPVLAALAVVLFAIIAYKIIPFHLFDLRQTGLLLCAFSGMIVSGLMVWQSRQKNNPFLQQLCGSTNNCHSLLASKAANAFWGISWAEIGLLYFTGSFLYLLFTPAVLAGYALIGLCALPYTFYSVYYQYKVAGQWCRLCLGIQALLWAGALLSFPALRGADLSSLLLSSLFLTSMTLAYGLPLLCWFMLKPLLSADTQLKPLKRQLQRFKYDQELFTSVLHAQKQVGLPSAEECMILGSPEPAHVITMVSNPYCPPCAKTHAVLEGLRKNNNNIQLRLVFTAEGNVADHRTPVVNHLLALHEGGDRQILEDALNNWYAAENKKFEEWAKVYPANGQAQQQDKIARQNLWCTYAGITATPTLFVNGYKLPDLYKAEDFEYLLT